MGKTDHGNTIDGPISLIDYEGPLASKKKEQTSMAQIMIIYHSQQYGNTKKMAELVAEGCQSIPGVEISMINVNEERVDMDEFAACDGVALGSPDYFSYVAGGIKQFFDDAWIARRAGQSTGDKPCVIFMSHGGGGRAMASLEKLCGSMKYEPVVAPLSCQRAPSGDAAEGCLALGKALGEHMSA